MSSFSLGLSRLRARPWLSLVLVLGIAGVVAIPASIARYSQTAALRALVAAVDDIDAGGRPPLSTLFEASTEDPRPWDEVAEASTLLTGVDAVDGRLGLPTLHRSEQIDSLRFSSPVGFRSLTTISDFAELVTLTAGRSPQSAVGSAIGSADQPIEVVVAETGGLDLDQRLTLEAPDVAVDDPRRRVDVVVVGIWRADDPEAEQWIVEPGLLSERLMVDRSVLVDSPLARSAPLIRSVRWYEILDGRALTTDRIGSLVTNLDRLAAQATAADPAVRLVREPGAALASFERARSELNQRLLVYAVPLLGLLVAFVLLTIAIITDDRARELVMIRNRGAGPGFVARSVAGEAAIIGLLALAVGLVMTEVIVVIMGSVRSFATFDGSLDIARVWPRSAVLIAAVVVGISIVVQTVPALLIKPRSSGRSTATAGRRFGDGLKRAARTVVFTAVVLGGLSLLDRRPRSTTDLLNQPTVVLLPALISLAIGLAAVELLPVIMRMVGAVTARGRGVPLLLTSRRLVRDPGPSRLPVLLIVITLASATFTATLARTLDLAELDRAHHQVGSTLRVTEAGGLIRPISVAVPTGTDGDNGTDVTPAGAPLEPTAFEAVPGIDGATRVADYSGRIQTGSTDLAIRVLAIDQNRFADVAFWRADYATEPTAELMRRLDAAPENIIVNRVLADDRGLTVGSEVNLTTVIRSQPIATRAMVVGIVEQVPTVEPDEPMVLARQDHLWLLRGESLGFATWLRASQPVDRKTIEDLGARVVGFESAPDRIAVAFDDPTRQSIFALLTVSYGGSVALSVAGLLLYALRSHRRSVGETGVLSALGLGFGPLTRMVVFDLGVLILFGMGFGLAGGLALGRWLTPVLLDGSQVTGPQLLASTAWAAMAAVTAVTIIALAAAVGVVIIAVRRIRLFEAIKMGGVG